MEVKLMKLEDSEFIHKLIKSDQNPISIITQQFDDIEIKNEFKEFYEINIIEDSLTWKKFLEYFYAITKVRPLLTDPTKKRILVINTDLIRRIPKEKKKADTSKITSVGNFIQFITTRCPLKVIFITEKPSKDYRMKIRPMLYGKIIDYSNYEYVAGEFLHSQDFDYKMNLLEKHHKAVGTLAFLVIIIQHYVHKYYPHERCYDEIIQMFFKLQFEVSAKTSYKHLALTVGFQDKHKITIPENFFNILRDKNVRRYEMSSSYLKNL